MDIGDNGEFRRRLIALGEVFDVNLSPTKQALYFEALRDVPFADVAAALNAAVKVCTFMPKPAEVRALALGDREDRAEAAWLQFRTAMRQFGAYVSIATTDAALGETILAVFGGWPEACHLELSPEMWAAKRKEFGRVYRVLTDRALVGPRYLFGVCEQTNQGRPDWQKYVAVGVLDGVSLRRISASDADRYRGRLAAAAHAVRQIADGSTVPSSRTVIA